MYEFRNLENVSFEDLANAHNLAFSDYIVPRYLTPEEIEAYFRVSGVDYSKSFGALYENKLIGMLVNSVDTFRGKTVAYDAMTGIAKEHRGKGIFSELFEYTKTILKSNNINHYYLEVITTNERAYTIYKNKGGKVHRELSYMTGRMNSKFFKDGEVKVSPLCAFPEIELSNYEPSFGNRITSLHRNVDDYQVAHIEAEDRIVAIVFNKEGGIPQIKFSGSDDIDLLYKAFTYLSRNFENLRISNIPVTETKLIKELLSIGFEILVNQYEMCIEF